MLRQSIAKQDWQKAAYFTPHIILKMANDKIQMPSGMGGLVRYFDEYKSKIEFKPGMIILFVIIVIIIEIILHTSIRIG